MRLDDIAADIVARNAPFVAALSTVEIPLVTLAAASFVLREWRDPVTPVSVFLDARLEELEEEGAAYRIVKMPVEFTVCTSGSTEAVLREQARNYAQAILNCLRGGNPYFITFAEREDYDGFEGKPDTKVTRFVATFFYEEPA